MQFSRTILHDVEGKGSCKHPSKSILKIFFKSSDPDIICDENHAVTF